MKLNHVIGFAVVILLGYYLGIKYPSGGQAVLSKVGL